MRIVFAGRRATVPHRMIDCLKPAILLGVVFLIAGLASAQTLPADTPAATEPATQATAEATTGPFLPIATPAHVQTSNGGDLIPQGQLINVEQPPKSPLRFSMTAEYMYGDVSGYTQVTRGGRPGTASPNRPTLGAIGINTANIADVEINAHSGNYGDFYVGAQFIPLSGSTYRGPNSLISDGVTFPPGSRVASDIGLNWYRYGYRYTLPIYTGENGIPEITFAPYLEGIVWDFSYHLTAPKVQYASRSITEAGIQFGAIFAWRPKGGPLSFEAALGGFPTIPGLPTISQENLYARYHFYQWDRFDFTGLLGVAFEQQSYRNNLSLPDHVSANFGPMLLVGVQVKF